MLKKIFHDVARACNHFPLFNKAVAEQKNIARFLGGELSSDLLGIYKRTSKILNTYLDDSKEDKEHAMIAGVFLVSSPFTFDDLRRFQTDYSETTHALAEHLVTSRGDPMFGTGDASLNLIFQKAGCALNAAMAELSLRDIKAGNAPMTLEQLQEAMAEAPKFNKTNFPKLAAYNDHITQEIVNTLTKQENDYKQCLTGIENPIKTGKPPALQQKGPNQ